mmetsp:Transcript_32364/g.50420  ORF Transcript_32364/g.50420 Transcript_32364/m.50420 type:complete len:520 (+) Transcript_32364:695-2254(+)
MVMPLNPRSPGRAGNFEEGPFWWGTESGHVSVNQSHPSLDGMEDSCGGDHIIYGNPNDLNTAHLSLELPVYSRQHSGRQSGGPESAGTPGGFPRDSIDWQHAPPGDYYGFEFGTGAASQQIPQLSQMSTHEAVPAHDIQYWHQMQVHPTEVQKHERPSGQPAMEPYISQHDEKQQLNANGERSFHLTDYHPEMFYSSPPKAAPKGAHARHSQNTPKPRAAASKLKVAIPIQGRQGAFKPVLPQKAGKAPVVIPKLVAPKAPSKKAVAPKSSQKASGQKSPPISDLEKRKLEALAKKSWGLEPQGDGKSQEQVIKEGARLVRNQVRIRSVFRLGERFQVSTEEQEDGRTRWYIKCLRCHKTLGKKPIYKTNIPNITKAHLESKSHRKKIMIVMLRCFAMWSVFCKRKAAIADGHAVGASTADTQRNKPSKQKMIKKPEKVGTSTASDGEGICREAHLSWRQANDTGEGSYFSNTTADLTQAILSPEGERRIRKKSVKLIESSEQGHGRLVKGARYLSFGA